MSTSTKVKSPQIVYVGSRPVYIGGQPPIEVLVPSKKKDAPLFSSYPGIPGADLSLVETYDKVFKYRNPQVNLASAPPMTRDLLIDAIENYNLPKFRWLLENGCPFDNLVFIVALNRSRLNCLKSLQAKYLEKKEEMPSPWTYRTFENALKEDLDILQFIVECGDCNEIIKSGEWIYFFDPLEDNYETNENFRFLTDTRKKLL